MRHLTSCTPHLLPVTVGNTVFPQTSTPASSFLIKSNTPESISSTDSLQRTEILLSASSDYIDIQDEDHKLPYR